MNEPNQALTQVPTRDDVHVGQIQILLNVVHTLQPCLFENPATISNIPKELDGGAFIAATTTFLKACGRLDAIIDDSTRWTLTEQDALTKALTEHFNAARDSFVSAKVATDKLSLPHRERPPQLTTFGDLFVAFDGNPHLPGGLILGKGANPEAAIADYDAAFTRTVAEQTKFSEPALARLRGDRVAPAVKRKSPKKKV